ncbi:MAG: hypothetical protein CM1200mP13_10870 [Candidatus Pelagibacterales bacterium]|nr:MAG: hypothetical protein CM1200mP13_10870 [Pelagibacterales bacterium]
MHTLKKFYKFSLKYKTKRKRLMFLSSHEPCSMCLSAITFSGFDNFYYLFPYTATNDEFNIPQILKILKEVLKLMMENIIKKILWKSQNINLLIENLTHFKKKKYFKQLDKNLKKKIKNFSNQYQENKGWKFYTIKLKMNTNLKISNVTKIYPGCVANDNVSLEFNSGKKFLLFLGKWCWKIYTGFKNFIRVNIPREGKIYLNENNLKLNSPLDAKKKDIGMVFQHFNLF